MPEISENRTTPLPRKLPFSLLGHIVYDNKCPIARIHKIPSAASDDLSEDPVRRCLVSGLFDHVEFDQSALRQVVEHVVDAYPEDCDLTTSLTLTSSFDSASSSDPTMAASAFRGNTKPSSILAEKCGFVGEVLDFGSHGKCVRCVDAFSKEAFWDVIRVR